MNPTLHLMRLSRAGYRLATLLRRSDSKAASNARSSTVGTDLDAAFDCFSAGQWNQAFEHLKSGADAGDPSASRIALMLEARGRRLFGKSFKVAPAQRERWSQVPTGAEGSAHAS